MTTALWIIAAISVAAIVAFVALVIIANRMMEKTRAQWGEDA